MKTNLILGPPGTGKTTFLIDQVKECLKAGYKINEIAYISFTRSAIQEAINRCYTEFPNIKKKEFIYFRTLHSLAYQERGIKKNQVIGLKQLKQFQDIMGDRGIEINFRFDEDSCQQTKNIPLYLDHIAKNKQAPIEEIYNDGVYDCSIDTVHYVTESYEEFKTYQNVIDFNDMLLHEFSPIDAKIVFLDEAQDLTPLQWDVFFSLFKNVELCFIAGDDEQAIYTWSGVDVNRFVNINYDKKQILKQSYRIPSTVHAIAKKISKRIKVKFKKEFASRSEKGSVQEITYIEDLQEKLIQDKKESWLFLVRNNYLSQKIKNVLLYIGVPFLSSIDKKDVKAIIGWERFRKGKEDYTTFLDQYTNSRNINKTWYEAFNYLDLDVSNYYRDCLRNGFKLTDPPKVEISTIHKSKGREADNVVLMTDCSANSAKENDSEHRVYYVGVTRAKQNLYILEPETNNYYRI
jgi:superfamily I DNA/RNA helicase